MSDQEPTNETAFRIGLQRTNTDLFYKIPERILPNGTNTIKNVQARQERENSQGRLDYLSELQKAISNSPGTDSFKRFILYLADDVYITGRTPDESARTSPNEEWLATALQLDDPFEGIYGLDGAHEAEDELLHDLQQRYTDYAISALRVPSNHPETPEGPFNLDNPYHLKQLIDQWRREYKEKYDEDPPDFDEYKRPGL